MAATYAHPVEHIFSNLLPTMAGPLILNAHLVIKFYCYSMQHCHKKSFSQVTVWVWYFIAVFTTLTTHSGYHLPFMPSSEAHDFHHFKFNQVEELDLCCKTFINTFCYNRIMERLVFLIICMEPILCFGVTRLTKGIERCGLQSQLENCFRTRLSNNC